MSNVDQLTPAENNVDNMQNDNNMAIRIRRNDLLKALSRSQGVSERKSINHHFSNIILNAKNNRLFLISKNASIQLNDSIPADVKKSGLTTVNTNLLYEICRKLPESTELLITLFSKALTIKTSTSNFELPIFTDTETDNESELEAKQNLEISIKANKLRDMLNKIQFAISADEVRHYLCGVYIETTDSNITTTATDGHRLASVEMSLNLQKEQNVSSAIIPRKTVGEIVKMLKDETIDINVELYTNKIVFSWGVVKLTSSLIEGKFPPYKSVIPEIDEKNVLTVRTDILKESIDRISSVSSEKTRAIKMSIEKNKLTLSAAATENGKANESLGVKYNGESISIGFNAKYLLDTLFNIEDEEVNLLIKGAVDPVRIFDNKHLNATYVIMPMRI
ncbi:Beta sliding clamp [Candidatus Xenohaliotis californiensis]|uniref:Beta sliding clamp n=1 Tax=Candidatus Xenohaliotis californiensis TaxID=84677 RepID=A0ABM9N9E8_9RICK|nr:Beta sliding clamp [Candidatus Xenohaliotis californiensis]